VIVIPSQPPVLEGDVVRLEPLTMDHLPRLTEIGLAGDVFRYYTHPIRTPEAMRAFVEEALQEQAAGRTLAFTTVLRETGQAIGSTRFGSIDAANERVEIGWTWIGAPWQRSAVNTEAKYLMLRWAFGTLGCGRVEFKTDVNNTPSRRAIARLGAVEEGVLRRHMVRETGKARDSVYYSIIAEEWPAVRARLQRMMERREAALAR
jgi:RimJ/RimL family protein N-acetyltransferase